MDIQILQTFAQLEIRTLLKLVRTWIFVFVALGISTTYFVLITWHHVSFSHTTVGLGSLGPRYSAATLAIYFVAVFTVFVVLSAMEIRSRDQRVRMSEVIAAHPVSNVDVFLGRLLGVLVVFAVPMLVFLVLVALYGWVSQWIGFAYGEPVAIWSVVSIALLDVGPNLLLFGSLVLLLSVVFRSRVAAATLTLMLMFISMWLHFRLPYFVTAPFQTITANVLFPSELAPQFLTLGVVVNRVALIALGLGFLWVASSLQSRATTMRSFQIQSGVGFVVLGVLLISGNFTASELGKQQVQHWAVVHQESTPEAFPDIVHLGGSVDIRPGNSIVFDFQLQVAPPLTNLTEWVVFSLNPGYRIDSLSVDGVLLERQKGYEFKDGLLKVSKLKFESELSTLDVSGRGHPNLSFAYLDTPPQLRQIVGPATRRLYHMGTENSIFHPRFVALLAATKWYPTSGSSWQEWNRDHRTRDSFTVDLTVSVPRNWIVAGPGRRETLNENRRPVFRFAPVLPVPEIALVGSNFIRRSIMVAGDEIELLISPQHQQMFRPFLSLAQEGGIRAWVASQIRRIRKLTRLEYPYSLLSIVEVPSSLRTYSSGWKLDSTLSAPGIIMLRETGFPTTRFEPWSDDRYIESETWALNKQIASFLMHQLINYVAFDMQGENPSIGFVRQLFEYQTAPTGKGANALEFMLLSRATGRPIVAGDAFFSFWECTQTSYAELFSLNNFWARASLVKDMQQLYFSQWDQLTEAVPVWEYLEQFSLADIAYKLDPRVVHGVLLAKTPQFPFSLRRTQQLDGSNTAASLETDVLEQYRGTTFSVEQFEQIAFKEQDQLTGSISEMFATKGVPGYQIGSPRVESNSDEATGINFYFNTFKLRNTQPASGSVTVAWDISPETSSGSYSSDYQYASFDIAGEQSYLITKRSAVPLERVWVKTGLSLNRNSLLRLDLDGTPEQSPQPIDDMPAISPIEWVPTTYRGIIVDDLDPGFSIERHVDASIPSRFLQFVWRIFSRSKLEWDYGLPVMQHEAYRQDVTTNNVWVREYGKKAFGRYRNTYAQIVGGTVSFQSSIENRRKTRAADARLSQKVASARFSTTLPRQGAWQLSYHLPFDPVLTYPVLLPFNRWQDPHVSGPLLYLPRLDLGKVTLDILSETHDYRAELDYSEAHSGWNVIGVYELDPTNVDVSVSNVTTGEIVIADAIRWLFVPKEE